ncbi:hypothetical protein F4677DRAFT_254233 [Hypoxylon crocopeplum]|nr:hypothetical protein F4677DRAFT_254233 [Hypoxylon crocopeplum]
MSSSSSTGPIGSPGCGGAGRGSVKRGGTPIFPRGKSPDATPDRAPVPGPHEELPAVVPCSKTAPQPCQEPAAPCSKTAPKPCSGNPGAGVASGCGKPAILVSGRGKPTGIEKNKSDKRRRPNLATGAFSADKVSIRIDKIGSIIYNHYESCCCQQGTGKCLAPQPCQTKQAGQSAQQFPRGSHVPGLSTNALNRVFTWAANIPSSAPEDVPGSAQPGPGACMGTAPREAPVPVPELHTAVYASPPPVIPELSASPPPRAKVPGRGDGTCGNK